MVLIISNILETMPPVLSELAATTLPPLERAPPQNSGPTTNCSLLSPPNPLKPSINELSQVMYYENFSHYIYEIFILEVFEETLPALKSTGFITFPMIIYEEEHDVDI